VDVRSVAQCGQKLQYILLLLTSTVSNEEEQITVCSNLFVVVSGKDVVVSPLKIPALM
jgi:hypothetical protein